MRLAHTDFGGTGTPILILHGLFGSSRNWTTVGRYLAGYGRAVGLDQRNHGRSPRSPSHSLEDLVGDLGEWVDENLREAPVLLGHSMGGLAAMGYALRRPERAAALIVVDIAPRAYRRDYDAEFRALRLDLSGFSSRTEIDRALEPLIPDLAKRRFLQTSIERGPAGFRWMVDGPALEASAWIAGAAPVFRGRFAGPTLLVVGGASSFVTGEDRERMRVMFPALQVVEIPGANHWVHASAPEAFRKAVGSFLGEVLPRAGR
jgi:esterase